VALAATDLPRRRGDGRVPPHNLEAEESLLGAMLLSTDAIAAAGEAGLSAADFYKPAHGHVYDAVCALNAAGEPVDAVTVAEELRRAGLLEAVGGPGILVSLQAHTPATSNATRYARIVEEHALLRRLIATAAEIAELGYSLPDDVAGAIDRAESLVFDVAQHRVADSLAHIHDLLDANLDRLEQLYERGDAITGIPTGYSDLDDLLSGLQPSNLVVVGARPAAGKALALDTPIPTPTGWTTMGEIRVGDQVFDDHGRPCTVVYGSPVFTGHRCFEVRFDDGTSIVADAGHRWLAYDFPAWKSHRSRTDRLAAGPPRKPQLARDQSARIKRPRIVTTQEMLDEGVRAEGGARPNWYIPLTAIHLADADLPVDPYALGCWLGDGNTYGASLTINDDDAPHFVAEFERAGYRLERRPGGGALCWGTSPLPGKGRWQGYDGSLRVLARELHAVGLLRRCRKHIPVQYLRASHKQRLALLQGVMDTDGTVSRRTGVVEICLANRELLDGVWELVASLGHKPNPIREKRIRLADGRVATAWRFLWTPPEPVFRLPRKASILAASTRSRRNGRARRRAIVDIVEVPSVPTRCIAVDAPSHLFLASRAMIPTHNTSFALGMASHAALHAGHPVLFFSLEMSHLELTQRLLCAEARVDSARMRNGRLQDNDWSKISTAIGRLAEAPIYIDDNPHLTVMEIRAKARRLKSRLGSLGMVVVDYLQLMTGRHGAENRQVEVSEISRSLKILARELETPVVALSQLSRALEMRSDKRPVLADLRESGCLTSDTRILRADTGAEPTLGELYSSGARDIPVWTVGDDLRLVQGTMTHVFESGTKPVFRLVLASGRQVRATANHPFLTIDGWHRLDELGEGSRIAIPRAVAEPSIEALWPDDEVILLAHMIGDGCAVEHQPVHYTSEDPENLDAVDKAALHFGVQGRRVREETWWHTYLHAPYRVARGRRNPIAEWLDGLGLYGKRAPEKFAPAAVYGLGQRQLALFLRHLWATDGHLSRQGKVVALYYGTTSRRLADDVQALLLRFGIDSRIRIVRKGDYRPGYQVWIYGAGNQKRFLREIGVHGARGRPMPGLLGYLDSLNENPNRDTVPSEVWGLVKTRAREIGMSHRRLSSEMGWKYAGSGRYRYSPTRPVVARLADVLDDPALANLGSSDLYWDEVVRIDAVGEEPVYDATVVGTHNFIANGIVVHNSIEQDADVVMFIYRDELYNPESTDRGTAEVIVAKHRSGPTGLTRLAFLDHYTRFANMARGT